MYELPAPLWHEETHRFLLEKMFDVVEVPDNDKAVLREYVTWPDEHDSGIERYYWHFYSPVVEFGGAPMRIIGLIQTGSMADRGKALHYLQDATMPQGLRRDTAEVTLRELPHETKWQR